MSADRPHMDRTVLPTYPRHGYTPPEDWPRPDPELLAVINRDDPDPRDAEIATLRAAIAQVLPLLDDIVEVHPPAGRTGIWERAVDARDALRRAMNTEPADLELTPAGHFGFGAERQKGRP